MTQALIIFARNEVMGKVKTRLAATIGNEQALRVYKRLLKHIFNITYQLPFHKFIFYSDYIDKHDLWAPTLFSKKMQHGVDLGEKMKNAFTEIFNEGAKKAVIIGTDSPQLSTKILQNAFDALMDYDIVIGPAKDGGYYLLGMKNLYGQLFTGITWSTDLVLSQTVAKCNQLNLSVCYLTMLTDVDDEKDLNSPEIKMALND